MFEGSAHAKLSVALRYTLGGLLVFAESYYDNYTCRIFSEFPMVQDFIYHPLRLRQNFIRWYLSHFEPLYESVMSARYNIDIDQITTILGAELAHTVVNNLGGVTKSDSLYFIGRKPLLDKGWEQLIVTHSMMEVDAV